MMADDTRDYLDFTAAVHRAVSAYARRTGQRIYFSARDRIAREAWQELHPGSTARRPWDAPPAAGSAPRFVAVELRDGQIVIDDNPPSPDRIKAVLDRIADLNRTIRGLL